MPSGVNLLSILYQVIFLPLLKMINMSKHLSVERWIISLFLYSKRLIVSGFHYRGMSKQRNCKKKHAIE